MRLNKCLGYVCVLSCCSHVWLFATPWTVAHQAPLSIEFSRQEYWNGLPCLPPEDLPDSGITPESFMSPALTDWFFTTWEALRLYPRQIEQDPWEKDPGINIYIFSFIFYTLYPIPQSSKPAFPTNALLHLPLSPPNRFSSKTFQSSPELSSHTLHI